MELPKFYLEIPTWNNGIWEETVYDNIIEFRDFVKSTFKEPGKYEFDNISKLFNEQARKYEQQYDLYCLAPKNTKDFIKYWNEEKKKCTNGCIFIHGNKIWYLPRDYYFWINFLPIYDKIKKNYDFPQVWDVQLHMALYELLAELHWKHAAIFKKRQIASEQPHSEPVLTTKGWSTMGDIQVGDELWNPNGSRQTILHKTSNGLSDIYEFEFADGRKTRCGIEHNWLLYDKNAKTNKVLNTKELLDIGICTTSVITNGKTYDNYRFRLSLTKPIELLNSKVPVNSYLLGCLLGDGHINDRSIYLSGQDSEIFDEIKTILGNDYSVKVIGYLKQAITYNHRMNHKGSEYDNQKYGVNPLLRELKRMGLGKAGKNTKFIPDIYKTSSIESRIALLQGLMDTDGYINAKGNNIHFTNVNKQLIDDVADISRSLGLRVTISEKTNKHGIFYRLLFSGRIDFPIFKLSRKLKRFKLRNSKQSYDTVPLIKITKLKYKEESSCIIVSNPNHLYITKDYIVTHNSYFHVAKLLNRLWFDEGAILKMGASLKDYIGTEGTWKFADEYKAFLNEHTAWYRPMNPGKVLNWIQQIEVNKNGRSITVGLRGRFTGMSFEQSPTKGVGGACSIFFYEEAGVAPTMDKTYIYMKSALQMGEITTGLFIAAGSVGELKDAEPLKKMINDPISNDIYAVETDLIDEKGTRGLRGLFIPEQWGMPPYIDEFGNSMVKEAMEALDRQREQMKKDKTPEDYQLEISQHPRNIKEGFAFREESKFPTLLIEDQLQNIEDKYYSYETLDLEQGVDGSIVIKKSNKLPISIWPVKKDLENKEGIIQVWERPDPEPKWGNYIGSIDPVAEGKSITSDSLCSIYIYKMPTQVRRIKQDGTVESFIEGDKVVACWCGRFDDINKTHERLRLLIEWYNAETVVENNVSLFIQYMIKERKQRYLVQKNNMLFLKEIQANKSVFQEYGWRNTGVIFKVHLLNYLIEFLKEVIDEDIDDLGVVTKKYFGIRRIPDIMAMREMLGYDSNTNVDRLVSLAALVAYVKIKLANTSRSERVENDMEENLQNQEKLFKLNNSGFRNIGRTKSSVNNRPRSGFKNIR